MTHGRFALLATILIGVVAFFASGGGEWLTFDGLKARHAELVGRFAEHPVPVALAFIAAYVVMTALSLPASGVMSLLAGALFGVWRGTLIVLLAASLGSTLAFWSSRYVFRSLVQRRFGRHLAAIDRGMRRDGVLYLITLRMIPVVPFFLVNLAMGLTALPSRSFILATQAGMLPATLAYANVGTRLGALDSPSAALSAEMIGSLAVLAALPLLARYALYRFRR